MHLEPSYQDFHTNYGANVNLTIFLTIFCTYQNNLIATEYTNVRLLDFNTDILINCWLLLGQARIGSK